ATPSASSPAPVPLTDGPTEFGTQIDLQGRTPSVPTSDQLQQLGATWERFVVTHSCSPSDPTLAQLAPGNAKLLAIFNNQSCNDEAPLASNDPNAWSAYVSGHFLPDLQRFLQKNQRVDAIEIWNEPDDSHNGSWVPPSSYAAMLAKSIQLVHSLRPTLPVLSGGLQSGDRGGNSYATKLFGAAPLVNLGRSPEGRAALRQLRLSIHPYDTSPDLNWWTPCNSVGQCQKTTLQETIRHYRSVANTAAKQLGVTVPVVVSEVGEGYMAPSRQAEYLARIFTTFRDMHVPLAIWFNWSDEI